MARFKNIVGGIRSGKTYSATRDFYKRVCADLQRSLNRCEKNEFLHYWLVTPNFPIGKVVMREMFATLRDYDPSHVRKWRKSVKELWLYPNILLEFKSANDPKVLVAAKIHGMLIDEMARLKPEAWQGGLRGRLTDTQGWGIFATSPLGKNWYYNEIVRRGMLGDDIYDDEFANFKFFTRYNEYIPAGEIESARRQLPPRYFRREYEASFEDFFGQILEEFNRTIHKYKGSPPEFEKIIAGVDWGYSNPGCLMVLGKTKDKNAKYYELETVYKDKMLVTKPLGDQKDTWLGHAKRLNKKFGGEIEFYPGKDEPEHIETFRQGGLIIKETDYGVNAGIQSLNVVTHVDRENGTRFFFSENVPGIVLEEFETYQWKRGSDEQDKEEPLKEKDHSPEAARYAIHANEKTTEIASVMIEPEDPDWYKPETYGRESFL